MNNLDVLEFKINKPVFSSQQFDTNQHLRVPKMVFLNGILQPKKQWEYLEPSFVTVDDISDGDWVTIVF